MDKKPCCSAPNHLVLGVVAIGFGLLFLLRNLGVLPFESVGQLWPLVFVLIGVLKVLFSARRGSAHDFILGGALVVLGSTMTLQRLGLIDFQWRDWWPMILIVVGLSFLFKGRGRPHGLPWNQVLGREDEEVLDATAIMGGYRRQIRAQGFRGGNITAIMGGCEIDLRNASIEGEAVLNIVAFWGGIELKVPTDWTVILEGSGILGGFVEKTKMPADSNKRLIVRGYAVMGGLEVKN